VFAAVRDMIVRCLPAGYRECMGFGMINYVIPLERYPKTYNGQPLGYVALAAQKNHFALYLMCVYMNPEREAWLREAFAKAGKKLDMGKSCVRFKKLDDLPLEALGELIAATPPESYIERYEASRRREAT
jgi:ribosomal protein L16/L10AE